MTSKTQKIISAGLVTIALVLGFEVLILIVNLNQIGIFLYVATAIWLYLWVKITLIYDLHFKNPGSFRRAKARHESVTHWLERSLKVILSALWDRIGHFRKWKMLALWLNYLLLPGLIFWATAGLFFLNLGRLPVQHLFALLSTISIIVSFVYIKEIYTRKEEKVPLNIFAALSMVKIYTALVVFGAAFNLTRYYCLEPKYLFAAVFGATFLIVYQALFQHNFNNSKNVFWALLIAFAQGMLAYNVYFFWGYNVITAAVFLTAFYNLFWGVFHHNLEGTLNKRVFWEIVVVSLFIAALSVSVTNFKAQILPGCF